jgi:hypothetical protein
MDEDKQFKAGIISRFRNDLRFRLRLVSYAVGAMVSIIFLATIALSVLVGQSSATLSDRLAGIGAIFAGMTLLLTLFAAGVAYLAFSVSVRIPDLKLQVRCGPSRPNRPSFTAELKDGRLTATDAAQTAVAICLRNDGDSAVKDLAVIVQLEGMEFTPDASRLSTAGWAVNTRGQTGVRAVQWDGGAASPVYAGYVRELPALDLTGLRTIPDWRGQLELARIPRSWLVGWFSRNRPPDRPPAPVIAISIPGEVSRQVTVVPVDFVVDGKSRFAPEGEPREWL